MRPTLDARVERDYNENMAQVSINLPPYLQHHIDSRVEHGDYADPAAYVRSLVERDQQAYLADVTRVQALIDEGIASGIVERDALDVLDEIIAGIPQPHV